MTLTLYREDAEFRSKGAVEQQEAPKTLTAFKTHPLYILQRNIGKYQAITPGTNPCGMHKCVPIGQLGLRGVLHIRAVCSMAERPVLGHLLSTYSLA